jgi:hypothetical protein
MTDLTPEAAVLNAAFSGPVPATPATAIPPTAAPPPPPGPVEPHTHASITEAEAAQMIEWAKSDLLSGKLTPEKANEIFDQLGATPEQRVPDLRTAEEKMLDALSPAAKPEQYVLHWGRPGERVEMTKELMGLDQAVRAGLSAAGFPIDKGNSVITLAAQAGHATKGMTEEQRITWGENEYVKLQRVHGDKLEEKLQQAGRMVVAIDTTGALKKILQRVGDSALLANTLIGHSEMYWARRKGR